MHCVSFQLKCKYFLRHDFCKLPYIILKGITFKDICIKVGEDKCLHTNV